MKWLSLLTWVTQFGFSAIFPLCGGLLLGSWLQNAYSLGAWVMVLSGILGFLVSISTVRSCLRAMRKATGNDQKKDTVVFNDHE